MVKVVLHKIEYKLNNTTIFHEYHFRSCSLIQHHIKETPHRVTTKKFPVVGGFRKRKLQRVLEKSMDCRICGNSLEYTALSALLRP